LFASFLLDSLFADKGLAFCLLAGESASLLADFIRGLVLVTKEFLVRKWPVIALPEDL